MPERVHTRPRPTAADLPENTVHVGHGTRYDNPFTVRRRLATRPETEDHDHAGETIPARWEHVVINTHTGEEIQTHRGRYGEPRAAARSQAVELYETITLANRLEHDPHWAEPLRGKDLACSCPTDVACHADVLLSIGNR